MSKTASPSTVEMFPAGNASEPFQRGRKLSLEFYGDEVPVLQRIEFRFKRGQDPTFWELNHNIYGMSWTEVPQALSMLFVDYLRWDKAGQPDRFYFSGSCYESHAASLGDALYGSGPIQELLVGSDTPGKPPKSQTKFIFNGDNVHGRATVERDRRISINKSILPPDCVEVIWKVKSGNPLSKPGDLLLLAKRLRSSLNLSPPQEFEAVKQTPTPKPPTLPVKSTPPTVPAKVTPTPVPETTPDNAPDWEGQDLSLLEKLKEYPECQKWGMGILSRMLQGMKPQEIFESPTMQKENTTLERVTAYYNILFTLLYPKDGRVIPEHFRIAPSEYEWPNDMTIWSAGGQDVWTLDDVTQGTLILGATGSGKSTCSGRTLAKAMLAKQFGGMILTTKPGEGREWGMFCDSVIMGF